MRRVPWFVGVALVAALLVFHGVGWIKPIPPCSTPYGVQDVSTCIAADGYPYRHGVQVG